MRRSRMRPKPLAARAPPRRGRPAPWRCCSSCRALSAALAVGDGQVGLVDLDHALQAIAIGPHHRSAKPVQHRPGGLVAAQPEHPLQPESADALLLVGQVPGRGQPDPKRGAGLVEDRARPSRCSGARSPGTSCGCGWHGTARSPRRSSGRRSRSASAVPPGRPGTRLRSRTGRGTRSRCVDKVDWTWAISCIFIQCIPRLLELSGYPL